MCRAYNTNMEYWTAQQVFVTGLFLNLPVVRGNQRSEFEYLYRFLIKNTELIWEKTSTFRKFNCITALLNQKRTKTEL